MNVIRMNGAKVKMLYNVAMIDAWDRLITRGIKARPVSPYQTVLKTPVAFYNLAGRPHHGNHRVNLPVHNARHTGFQTILSINVHSLISG